MIYLCVHGCGEFKVSEMYQDKEALADDDKSLYCPECHNCEWYIIPEEELK